MYPVTTELAELFANQRQVVKLTFDSVADSIVLTEADIKSGGLVIDRTCVSGDTIELGSVIASELGVQLNNTSGQFNDVTLEGAECYVEVGTKDWSDEEAEVQYIPMGYFTVDGSPRKLDTISFKALDRMVKFDRPVDFTQLSFPMTVSALLSSICTICGVTLNTGYQSNWVNTTRSIAVAPEADNLTYRQLLSWICEIMGTCAYIGADGNLNVHWYGQAQPSTPSITAAVRYNSDVQENAITLTGIRLITDNNTYIAGTDTYALTIEGNPLIQSGYQTVANNIYNARGGMSYTPFTATVKSMPHLYPLDIVNFIKGESTIPSIITKANYALNSSTVLEGTGQTQIENDYAELNPMTTQQTVVLNKLHSKTVQEFKVADGELLSTIANSESKYDESTSPGTITLRGYGAPADAGYPAADHNGAYYLDEMTGFVYFSDGTSWSKVAELNLITTQLDTKIDQTAEGMLFSASQMIGGERTKNLIPFVLESASKSSSSGGTTCTRNGDGYKLTKSPTSGNQLFTLYTSNGVATIVNSKLPNSKTLPTGKYIVSGTGFNNDIQYRIVYSTDGSTRVKIKYLGENGDTAEKAFEITDAMTYVQHYIWIREGTDLGSGVTVRPMIRDATITDSTYSAGIDAGAYMCSAINITPERLELDSGKLIINSGNFQLDDNGVVTSTAGTFKSGNYSPASGSTKTVGGQLNLDASGSELIVDTANFKVSGGGAVSAEDATFTNCTIEGGSFEVDSTEQSGQVTSKIHFSNSYLGDSESIEISSEKIKMSRTNTGGSRNILLDYDYTNTGSANLKLESQFGSTWDKALYSASKIRFNTRTSPTASITYVDANNNEHNALVFGGSPQNVTLGNEGTITKIFGKQTYISSIDSNNVEHSVFSYIGGSVGIGNLDIPVILSGSRVNLASPSVTINDRPVATSAEIEARLEATVGHSSKNLLPITLESGTYTEGGANLTYTVDKAAGTITINGTSRTNDNDPITLHIFDDSTSSLNGKLYFSGGSEHCPVRAYDGTNSAWTKAWNGVDNSPYSYSESQSSELAPVPGHETQYRIRIAANQTILNEVVKPMLRDGSISDDTFEPYVTPTDERIASLEAQIAALTALINGR